MRRKTIFRIILLLFLILNIALVSSCFWKAQETEPSFVTEVIEPSSTPASVPIVYSTAPTINSTNPETMAMGVKINITVTATFNEQVDPSTINTNTFVLQRGTTPVEGTVTYIGTTATFTPSAILAYATTYTATITKGVRNLLGNFVTSNYAWSFNTEAPPDRVALTVISTTPANATKGVATNSTVTATFNKEIDPSTFTQSSFTLKQGITSFGGIVTCAGTVVTIKPTKNLAYDTFYSATITAGVKDLAGNTLENDFTWSFTTATEIDTTAPTVVSVFPPENANDVPVNTILKAIFSEAVNASSLTTAAFTVSGGVHGTVTYSDNTVSFTPSANLSYATGYTVTITKGVSDLAGNTMANDYAYSFTTEYAPVVILPPVNPPNPERIVTLTDNDLPPPPVEGMGFHFLAAAPGEYGPGKIRLSYGALSWDIWFGVTDGKLWVYHLPKREILPESLQGFYDFLGINENTIFTEEDEKYWFTGLPPWMNIAKYDPEVVNMPVLITVESSEGQAKIHYKIRK
jgi:hypothetical protein